MMAKKCTLAALALACLIPFPAAANLTPRPKFVVVANHYSRAPHNPTSTLPQWSGSFTDLTHKSVSYVMVGTDPASTNGVTTIPVVLIPVKVIYGRSNGSMTFDPKAKKLSNGNTVVQNTLDSPLFQRGIEFVEGGIDIGKTQYIDAFQRANFWAHVKTNTHYHVLLGTPTVLAEQTITVSSAQGKVIDNPFASGKVGTITLSAMDSKLQTFVSSLGSQLNPGLLPIFLTYDVFVTQNGCCIGGFHTANGAAPNGQTYVYGTYVDQLGSFSQDVSALSHELGEWMDDPFVGNHVNCTDSNVMEVGDPLENEANFGAYPYTLNGFTYNLQSLVFMDYFGAPRSGRLKSWLSFQNDETNVCPGQ